MSEWDKTEMLEWIQKIPFFANFTQKEKEQLADLKSHVCAYGKNQVIIRQDDIDLSLFVLIRGEVYLTRSERPGVKIATLKSGAIFGEVSFLKPRSRPTNVVAVSEVLVLRMDGETLEKTTPALQGKIKDKIIEMLIFRLEEMNNALITYTR